MEAIGTIVFWLGMIMVGLSSLWVLVIAFSDSFLWGLLCLIIGPLQLVYIITHWSDCKDAVKLWALGFAVAFGGGFLSALAG